MLTCKRTMQPWLSCTCTYSTCTQTGACFLKLCNVHTFTFILRILVCKTQLHSHTCGCNDWLRQQFTHEQHVKVRVGNCKVPVSYYACNLVDYQSFLRGQEILLPFVCYLEGDAHDWVDYGWDILCNCMHLICSNSSTRNDSTRQTSI